MEMEMEMEKEKEEKITTPYNPPTDIITPDFYFEYAVRSILVAVLTG